MPMMWIVESGEEFGLTGPNNRVLPTSLPDVKEEMLNNSPNDATDFHQGLSIEDILASMKINPSLLLVPARKPVSKQLMGSSDQFQSATCKPALTCLVSSHLEAQVVVRIFHHWYIMRWLTSFLNRIWLVKTSCPNWMHDSRNGNYLGPRSKKLRQFLKVNNSFSLSLIQQNAWKLIMNLSSASWVSLHQLKLYQLR